MTVHETLSALNDQEGPIRQSNMELLRIIAMSMIIIGHIIWHGVYYENPDAVLKLVLIPWLMCGVNLFFLISGYFRIKLSLISIFKIVALIFIFECVNIICVATLGGGNLLTIKSLISLIAFPISKSYYWFIQVYLGLMFLAPLLNAGLEAMSDKNLRLIMIMFTLFTIYSCWIGHNLCNNDGYSFGQGIYMYCMAQWIKREHHILNSIPKTLYLVTILILLVTASLLGLFSHSSVFILNNSFFNVIISLCLFIYFTTIKLQSFIINTIASAALGCYLLQDGLLGTYIYPWQHQLAFSEHDTFFKIILFTVMFMGFWFASYMITYFSNKILILPLIRRISGSRYAFSIR